MEEEIAYQGERHKMISVLICKECSQNLKVNLKKAIEKNELRIISRQI